MPPYVFSSGNDLHVSSQLPHTRLTPRGGASPLRHKGDDLRLLASALYWSMQIAVAPCSFGTIQDLRTCYQQEMACQIVHDSLHQREGWVEWFSIRMDDAPIGYGSIAVGGPWAGTRTVFEYFVSASARPLLFDSFATFVGAARATAMVVQTNDPLLNPLLHLWSPVHQAEKIVFADVATTALESPGATFRRKTPADAGRVFEHTYEPEGAWVLEAGGEIVATGDFALHYNAPYSDLYVEVRPDARHRGYGSYLVQELKRVSRAAHRVPCARCVIDDVASRRTIQKAGLAPCAHVVAGEIRHVTPTVR